MHRCRQHWSFGWLCVVVSVAYLVLLGMPGAAAVVTSPATGLPPDVFAVATGVDDAAQRLQSAAGSATFVRRGHGELTNLRFDFWIDGPRIRWDVHRVGEQRIEGETIRRPRLQQEAYNGEHGLTARYGTTGGAPRVYVHPPEDMSAVAGSKPYSGYYTGVAFSPRGFYIPQRLSFGDSLTASLRRLAESGTTIEVGGDLARDREVVLSVKQGSLVRNLTVDVARGFVITREESLRNGESSGLITREYKESPGGAMALTRYLREPSGPRGLYQEVVIEYDTINESVPKNLFRLAGFGLPPGVTVRDLTRKLTFKLSSTEEVQSELDDVLSAIPRAPPPSAPIARSSDSGEEKNPPPSANESETANSLPQGSTFLHRLLPLVSAALIFGLLGAYCLRRFCFGRR